MMFQTIKENAYRAQAHEKFIRITLFECGCGATWVQQKTDEKRENF